MKATVKTLLGLAACSALMLSVTGAADESTPPIAQRCVDTMRIRSTHILDDQNILFYMRGGKIYHNRLSHACPGLRHNPFMYSIPSHQLCNVDIITVLEDHGFGFQRGASCGLGDFTPITKDAADQMKQAARNKSR